MTKLTNKQYHDFLTNPRWEVSLVFGPIGYETDIALYAYQTPDPWNYVLGKFTSTSPLQLKHIRVKVECVTYVDNALSIVFEIATTFIEGSITIEHFVDIKSIHRDVLSDLLHESKLGWYPTLSCGVASIREF
jgi:hypothetical protein